MRNPRLERAFRSFVERSLIVLRTAIDKGHAMPEIVVDTIHSISRTGWSGGPKPRKDWYGLVARHWDEIRDTPEHAHCRDLLSKDQEIAPQLNKVVGTRQTRTIVQESQILPGFLSAHISEQESLEFIERTYVDLYRRMEDFFYSDSLQLTATAPLLGFYSVVASIPLSADVQIDRLSLKELQAFYEAGTLGQSSIVEGPGGLPSHAMRGQVAGAKIVGSGQGLRAADSNDPGYEAWSRFQAAVEVLRLFQTGFVALAFMTLRPEAWRPAGGPHYLSYGPRSAAPAFSKYDLDEDQVEPLIQLGERWAGFKATGWRNVELAVSRLFMSAERVRATDRLIDSFIALEALFLADIRVELRYRFALRASHLMARDDAARRRRIFDEMKSAYDLRSQIVHGELPPQTIKVGDQSYTLVQYAERVEALAREAIHRFLDIGKQPDWDELIVGPPNTLPGQPT